MTASLLLLLLGGCPKPCSGAGCSDDYPAEALRMFDGAALGVAELSPSEAPPVVVGGAEEGNQWSLAAGEGALFVGVPDVDEVWRYDATALAEAGGPAGRLSWGTLGDTYGASVAVWDQPDGTARLLVGAPLASSGPGLDGAGAVLVYDAGFSGTTDAGAPLLRMNGAAPEGRLGTGVTGCGDLDDDGAADWAAWSPWGSTGGNLGGDLAVYLTRTGAAITLSGADAEAFGSAVVCRSSLDADGVVDLAVGAPGGDRDASVAGVDVGGTVSIWHGGVSVGQGPAALVIRGRESAEEFGAALAVGDLDADGAPDLVVGAPGRTSDGAGEGINNRAGAAYVYLGRRLRSYLEGGIFLGTYDPDYEIRGVYARERLGAALVLADLDADGADELLVGAPGLNPTGAADAVQSGAIYVYHFGDWSPVQDTSDAATTVTEPRQYLRTGERLLVGDVTGDGTVELVFGNHVAAP